MSVPNGLSRPPRSNSLGRPDPYSSPDVYYGDEDATRRQVVGARNRAISSVCLNRPLSLHRPRLTRNVHS
jgi:hypothetical protein